MISVQKSEYGFTLVELSIVLVIIGLLIGGILVGQSLINSAKLQSQIRQFSQMDIAITNFQGKYKKLPGDSSFHSVAGDGDGELENSVLNGGTKAATLAAFDYEIANFWRHLQQSGFLTKEYPTFSNNAASGIRVGVHVPKAILGGGKTGIAPFYCNIVNSASCSGTRYYLANFDAGSDSNITPGTTGAVAAINVADMAALDTKFDDGIAYTSNSVTYSAGKINTSSYSTTCYIASGNYYKYDITSGANCYFVLAMKAVNGLD